MTDQLEIPIPVQYRKLHAEPLELYEDVLFLRRSGKRVYRCGRAMHMIDGHRFSARDLKQIASAVRSIT